MARLELTFAAQHPTAAGHFPGNPIIPGALLLAEVLHLIGVREGSALQAGRIKTAKFLYPVRPGETVIIDYAHSAAGLLQFECAVGSNKVLIGSAAHAPAGT
jgi:3-hydroxyacyl-[acyl-carrier-protein] dehydratase